MAVAVDTEPGSLAVGSSSLTQEPRRPMQLAEDPMTKYTHPLPLHWADADTYGHVNNSLFLTHLEGARTRMFHGMLPADEAERRQHELVYLIRPACRPR